MRKTIFAGFLVLLLMIGTAIRTAHKETSLELQDQFKPDESQRISVEKPYTGSITSSTFPRILTAGKSKGMEGNPFVIAAGLTVILCGAFGFWKYHQIYQDRQAAQPISPIVGRKES